jgi:hypothetical protein
LAALAIAVSQPIMPVQAQSASAEGVAVGTRILPSGTGAADKATLVTPDDIAQADAGIAATSSVTTGKPFMPTDDPIAYAAAKAAASTAVGPARGKSGAATGPAGGKSGVSAATPLAAPTPRLVNYAGLNQTTAGGAFPPNTHGAVGPAHFVQVVDVRMTAFNKAQPGTQLCTFTLKALHGASESIFDPRVVYDPTWNRWVFVATRKSASSTDTIRRFFIAVSTTGNPCGSYFRHTFNLTGPSFNAGDWLDFPGLGMNQDAVLITGNVFDLPTGGFKFAAAIGIAKARLYNGLAFSVPIFTTPFGTLQPPIVYDQNKDAYFLAANNRTHLHLFRGNNLSNAAEATFVLQATVDVEDYGVPPPARQVGTAVRLDTLDGRFVNASTQIGDSLWNVHTITCGCEPTTFAIPMFYEIDTEGAGANTVKQQGSFFESDTSDDFNASITANAQREAFVTWTSTDALNTTPALRHQARMRISGRQPADLPGLIGPGSTVFTSSVALTGNDSASDPNVQRWGEYSAVTLDPQATSTCAANRRAWAVSEVINSANVWGSRIARTGFCD